MALSGQLSDLSLAELIEFFCNQRKTGRLKIAYHRAPGYFYFDRGELVDAKIGALTGIDAVYFALTQENASFKFSTAFEATRRTIHQPWSHVVLEGLRRLDEGVTPKEAFPEGLPLAHDDEPDEVEEKVASSKSATPEPPQRPAPQVETHESAPLSLTVESSNERGRSRTFIYAAVIAALVLSVAAIGFPAGWYGKRKEAANAPAAAPETKADAVAPAAAASTQTDAEAAKTEEPLPASDAAGGASVNGAALRQQQEREARAAALAAQERARQNATVQTPQQQPAANPAQANKPEAAVAAPQPQKKTVTVQVTYDENGRVTQASGGDGMAQRIARQKRFPTGKGGTTTVTIPVN